MPMLEKFGRFDIQALLVVGPFSKLESVVGKSYQVDKQRAMRLRDVPLRYRSTSIIPSLHTFSIVIIETAMIGVPVCCQGGCQCTQVVKTCGQVR